MDVLNGRQLALPAPRQHPTGLGGGTPPGGFLTHALLWLACYFRSSDRAVARHGHPGDEVVEPSGATEHGATGAVGDPAGSGGDAAGGSGTEAGGGDRVDESTDDEQDAKPPVIEAFGIDEVQFNAFLNRAVLQLHDLAEKDLAIRLTTGELVATRDMLRETMEAVLVGRKTEGTI